MEDKVDLRTLWKIPENAVDKLKFSSSGREDHLNDEIRTKQAGSFDDHLSASWTENEFSITWSKPLASLPSRFFEISISEGFTRVAIGLAEKDSLPPTRFPGHAAISYGYHSDDNQNDTHYNPKLGTSFRWD